MFYNTIEHGLRQHLSSRTLCGTTVSELTLKCQDLSQRTG